jgi:hypothetical protein
VRLAVFVAAVLVACEQKQQKPPVPQIDASVPSASVPSASVALGDAPDVRVTLPEGRSAVVRTGQTFGILVPHPADFFDEWELEPDCPLGKPLAFISRGDIGRELLWKIDGTPVGTHVVKLRLMHGATRTSVKVPIQRAQVTVLVTER